MRTVQKSEEAQELELLPLCESNRGLVLRPTLYVDRIVFRVGALTLLDKAP